MVSVVFLQVVQEMVVVFSLSLLSPRQEPVVVKGAFGVKGSLLGGVKGSLLGVVKGSSLGVVVKGAF